MAKIKKSMTSKEKCDLIEASLPRFFGSSIQFQKHFKVSRQIYGDNDPREYVVLESDNGIFNVYWMYQISLTYVFLIRDGKVWLQSIRNLNVVMNAL
mgnify:CR=1 FL=1